MCVEPGEFRQALSPGVCSLLVALLALTVAAPVCGPLDLETAQAAALARSDEVGIKRSEVATAEADKAYATAIRFLPEFSANVPMGVVPGARLVPDSNPNDITAIESGSNRGLTDLGPFIRVEVNALQPLWTWGRIDAANDAAAAGMHGPEVPRRRHVERHPQPGPRAGDGHPAHHQAAGDRGRRPGRAQGGRRPGAEVAEGERRGDLLPRTATASRSSAASSRSASPTGSGRFGSRGWAWRRPWRWSRTSSSSGTIRSPDTAQVRAPDLVAGPVRRRAAAAGSQGARHGHPRQGGGRARQPGQSCCPRSASSGSSPTRVAPGRDIISNPYVGDYFNALTVGAALVIRQNLSFWTVITATDKKAVGAEHAPQAARRRGPGHPASRWRTRSRS